MSAQNGRLLSGIKPTGELHLGNFFGAIKQLLDLQDEYEEIFIFVADYHALTTCHNPEELRKQVMHVAAGYLALGIDPQKVTLFQQSQIPEHTELAWIFNCITNMGYLERSHAYKSAKEANKDVSVGTFDYPMLMAADILLYDADTVPVGSDQKQHIEFARDTAERFNHMFGETFKLPESSITKEEGVVPGIDGQKMSKSNNNTIPIFGTEEEIQKAVTSIVTGSQAVNDPKDENDTLIKLYKLINPDDTEYVENYVKGEIGYQAVKNKLSQDILEKFKDAREAYSRLIENSATLNDKNKAFDALRAEAGKEKVSKQAQKKMSRVRSKIGVDIGDNILSIQI